MKKVVLSILLLVISVIVFSQILYRETVDDYSVSSHYVLELEMIKAKYKLPTAFGYTKTITQSEDKEGINETIIVFYKSKTKETQEKIISIRYISLPKKQN